MHFRFAEFLFIGDIFGQLYGSGFTMKAAVAALRKPMVLDRKCSQNAWAQNWGRGCVATILHPGVD